MRPVRAGRELPASAPATLGAQAPVQQFLTVPLQRPAGGPVDVPAGARTVSYTYAPNDTSVGDLDGDGEYEIVVKWDPSNARDTASPGLSGRPMLDAYRLDGTRLWRIDLGRNIRAGAHYTQFIVYDLDGDGRAEVACKTADGTVDGQGRVIGDASKDYRSLEVPTDGAAGEGRRPIAATARCSRGPSTSRSSTDAPARRSRRPRTCLAASRRMAGVASAGTAAATTTATVSIDSSPGVAYLDGRLPSVIMARGYYGRSVIAAWDWRRGQLSSRWVFDSGSAPPPYPNPAASPYSGQGNHSLSIADVDADGKDEIVYGAMVVDDDGKGLFSTGLRHGDALHVGDLDPARPGLEVFGIHENEEATVALQTPGAALLRRPDGPDPLEPAARRRRRTRAGCRHRSAASRRRVLDQRRRRPLRRARGADRRGAAVGQLRRLVGRGPAARDPRQQLDRQMGLDVERGRQAADRDRRGRRTMGPRPRPRSPPIFSATGARK